MHYLYCFCHLVAVAIILLHLSLHTEGALSSGAAGHTLSAPLIVYGNVSVVDSSGTTNDLLTIIKQQQAMIQDQSTALSQLQTLTQQQATALQQLQSLTTQQTATLQQQAAAILQLQNNITTQSTALTALQQRPVVWLAGYSTASSGNYLTWQPTSVRGTAISCTTSACSFNAPGTYHLYYEVAASGASSRVEYNWVCYSGDCGTLIAGGGASYGYQAALDSYTNDAVITVTAATVGCAVGVRSTLVSGSVLNAAGYIEQL